MFGINATVQKARAANPLPILQTFKGHFVHLDCGQQNLLIRHCSILGTLRNHIHGATNAA